jgi:hypothetical protein
MKKINAKLSSLLIDQEQWNKSIFLWVIILLGIALPFLLVTYIDSYFRGDINIFHSWVGCWNQRTYIECQIKGPPNYPVAGLALSAGVIHAIIYTFGIIERTTGDLIFRYYLAFFDSLNFLLFIWLANLMRFPFPIFIGIILLIIPSNWVGSAVWGQIDGISLFFCLLSVICFFKSWRFNDTDTANRKAWKSGIYLILGTGSFAIYILTKQLAIFSLPFFLILGLITAWRYWQLFQYKGIVWIFLALIFFIFFFRSLDSLLEVPEQFYNSSYWFVWKGGGSEHGNKISGNGLNIWMFLGRDMWSSSHIPFLSLKLGNFQYNFSPYQTGISLYSIFISLILFTCGKAIWKFCKSKIWSEQRDKAAGYLISLLFLFHGLCHLGFNVLLSGTHERYLYLGYPFLLIAITWFYINQIEFSLRSIIFCFFAALAYGCFVFSIMGPLPQILFPFQRHEFLASLHLFILVFLLDSWINISKNIIKRIPKISDNSNNNSSF